MDLMVQKCRFGKERYIKQNNELDKKRSCLERIRGYNTGGERGGSMHSFAK